MILSIIMALMVAFLWSIGEVNYSELSKSTDNHNVYFYQYLARSIIYLFVVIILKPISFTRFSYSHFMVFLPIILCDLFASYVVNIAVSNGKLSVVSPIMAAYPILDIILGISILKEQVSLLELILVTSISISILVLTTTQTKSSRAPHPIKGIIFSIIYMILIALSTFLEKTAYMDNFEVFELYYYKGIIYFFTSLFFMSIVNQNKKKIRINKDIIKGTAIVPLGNVVYSFALNIGTISIISPISSMYSVITNYISRKILKEKTTLIENLCISIILFSTIALITISAKHIK